MSKINDIEDDNIKLTVDYRDISNDSGNLPVRIHSYPERLKNLILKTDSIEYTIVKENVKTYDEE